MRNLFLFIWRHYFTFLFILLEFLCFYLVVQHNYYQHASFINSSNAVSAGISGVSANIKEYFYLRDENEMLAKENAELRGKILSSFASIVHDEVSINDTVYHQKYTFTSAKVVNNSTNFRNNFLTLDKGSLQGIKKNMGVISANAVVGQVKDVSENFCTVMSLLNSKTTISSKLQRDGSIGPLTWEEENDFNHATLRDIPTHVKLKKNDTIVTSVYSPTYPAEIRIGTIEDFQRKSGEIFYSINVKLITDFKKLTHVYIVNNMMKEEQEELENKSAVDKTNTNK